MWIGGPCYPIGEIPEYVDCQRGTYSETGYAPCQQCPNNTYANIRETSCTPCPAHSSTLVGASSLTECVCDAGYWSPWATGGPCYSDDEEPTPTTEESSTGPAESLPDDGCSHFSQLDCERHSECQGIYGHSCETGKWQFFQCIAQSICDKTPTCAEEINTNERGWFTSNCLPAEWSSTSGNEKCGSCCKPQQHSNSTHGSVGAGCSFVDGSVCALLEFQGECPSMDSLNIWRISIIDLIARVVSHRYNISKAEATISMTVNTYPRSNTGSDSCAVRLQIFPPVETSLTANDFLIALYTQLSESVDGTLDNSVTSIKLSGIVAHETYGSISDKDITVDTSAAISVTATGVMITSIIAIATVLLL